MNPNATPAQTQSGTRPDEFQASHMHKVADPRADTAGRSAGMPAVPHQPEQADPAADDTTAGSPLTPRQASLKSRIRLPHERDQDTAMTDEPAQAPPLQQAAEDLARGLKDTSRANETDATYHRLHETAPDAPAQRASQALDSPRSPQPAAPEARPAGAPGPGAGRSGPA